MQQERHKTKGYYLILREESFISQTIILFTDLKTYLDGGLSFSFFEHEIKADSNNKNTNFLNDITKIF